MKHINMVRTLVLSAALAAGTTAFAQISFNIVVAPPAPMYETVPLMKKPKHNNGRRNNG